jgi:hypothetical protein
MSMPADNRIIGRSRWLEYGVVSFAASAALYVINFRDGVFIWSLSQQEGAIWIDEAYRMIKGEMIYRDFFDFLGPGVTLVDFLFLRIFGPTTAGVGFMVVTVGAAIATTVYAVASEILWRPWRLVAVAVFVGLNYAIYSPGNHKWIFLLFCLLGILAVLHARSPTRSAVSGVLIGFATWSTQDYGVGAALGLFAALWLLRRREPQASPIVFAMTYAVTVVAVFVQLGLAAGFRAVWYDLFVFLFDQYGASHLFAYGFGESENLPIWLSSFGLGCVGLIYVVAGVIRQFWKTDDPAVVILALTGGSVLLAGIAHPIEPIQVAVRAVPLSIIGLHALQRIIARRFLHPFPLLAVVAVGAIVVWHIIDAPVGVQYANPKRLETYRAGQIWGTRLQEDTVWVQQNSVEGQKVFAFPDKGGLYFLTRTTNATSYPMLLEMGFHTPRQIDQAIAQLETTCPQIGIWHWNRLSSFVMNRPERFTLKPIWEYLQRNYDTVDTFPNGAIALRRKADAGCGRS